MESQVIGFSHVKSIFSLKTYYFSGREALYVLSILTAQTLSSGILETGSRAGLVSTLAGLSAK